MALQMRRGVWDQFDPTQMVAGEFATILSGCPHTANGRALYHCTAAGSVERIATIEDMIDAIMNTTDEIAQQFASDLTEAIEDAEAATGAANDAADAATTSAGGADTAANGADAAAADARLAAAEARGAVRPDMALYIDYDTVGNIQYISLVDANE